MKKLNIINLAKYILASAATVAVVSCNSTDNDFETVTLTSGETTTVAYPSVSSVDTDINYLVVDFTNNFTLNNLGVVSINDDDVTEGSTYELTELTGDDLTDAEAEITYEWDFGDGDGESTEENPSYTYEEAGTYTVTLTVYYDGEDLADNDVDYSENIYEFDVTVADNDTSFDTTGLFDYGVSFSNTSTATDDFTYSWDFGDDSGTSTDESPSYQYAAAGDYTVILTATNVDNSDYVETYSTTVTVCVLYTSPSPRDA